MRRRGQEEEEVQLSPGAFMMSAVQFSQNKKTLLTIYSVEVRVCNLVFSASISLEISCKKKKKKYLSNQQVKSKENNK